MLCKRNFMTLSKHCNVGLAFTLAAFLLMRAVSMAAPSIACDSGNGGLTLPAGFCAIVVANDLGAARHATVAPNGDLYVEREHREKGIAFDGKGSLYINVGSPSNACQSLNRQPGVAGQDPCPILEKHGGIWKFDENKLGQRQENGTRIATALRQEPAITWHDGAVYIVMNNRDQLDAMWPDRFTGGREC
jgi:hypothetical protein